MENSYYLRIQFVFNIRLHFTYNACSYMFINFLFSQSIAKIPL